jgi:hypothetical protein
MIQIDGKTVDVTKFKTWGELIKIHSDGFIEQRKDGVTSRITCAVKDQDAKGHHEPAQV